MLAIIGGSGLTQLANLDVTRREVVRTPYGEPSGPLTFSSLGSGVTLGTIQGKPVRLRFVMRDSDLYSIRFADR